MVPHVPFERRDQLKPLELDLNDWLNLVQELQKVRKRRLVRCLNPLHVVWQERPPVPLLAGFPPPKVVPWVLGKRLEPVDPQALT